MQYVGLHTQQVRNNTKSILLLLMFPTIMVALVYAFFFFIEIQNENPYRGFDLDSVNYNVLTTLPFVLGAVGIWFLIAYFANTSIIRKATGAKPLERRENPRVYNIVENLCMAAGMDMPKINVVDDPMLNAFASGIDKNSYTVTVTTGICDCLNDDELAGVIAHELTHIRNRDTRLLIISIIFVGIMSFLIRMLYEMLWRNALYGNSNRSRNNGKGGGGGIILIVGLILAVVGYFFTVLTRFAISRKREYMADAGGAELCGNPLALASALRKISGHTGLSDVKREDVAQLFIVRPQAFTSGISNIFSSLFSTHPSIESRIAYLESV